MSSKFFLLLTLSLSVFANATFAMDFTTKKLYMWKKGETIAGDDFIAANEDVVDYIATLNRPTEPFKSIVYQCQMKTRMISPNVQYQNTGNNSGTYYVYLLSVYGIKDCQQLN